MVYSFPNSQKDSDTYQLKLSSILPNRLQHVQIEDLEMWSAQNLYDRFCSMNLQILFIR